MTSDMPSVVGVNPEPLLDDCSGEKYDSQASYDVKKVHGGQGMCYDALLAGCVSRIALPLWHVGVLIVLMYFGNSVTNSVTPGLITQSLSSRYTPPGVTVDCSNQTAASPPPACTSASSEAALIMSLMSAASAVAAFVISPTLGAMSDSVGRRPFFILAAATGAIPRFTFAGFALGIFPLWTYYAGMAIDITTPGISVALAYSGDIIAPQHRGTAAGLIMAAFSLTFTVGPFISVYTSLHVTLLLSVGTAVLAIVWAWFAIPESVQDKRSLMSQTVLNPFKNVTILFRTRLFMMLAACVILNATCTDGVRDVFIYFLIDLYNLTGNEISTLLIAIGISSFVVQGILIRPLVAGVGHRKALWVGLGASLANMALFWLVQSRLVVLLQVSTLMALGAVVFPTVCSIKSINVDSHEQGLVQGALYGVQQLGSGAGPIVLSALFKMYGDDQPGAAHAYYPQAPFVLATGLTFIALVIAFCLPDATPNMSQRIEDFELLHRRGSTASQVVHTTNTGLV